MDYSLPAMRQQKAGHIIDFSSVGGYSSAPGFGVYCSTKFAVEGISEALYGELAPLGIHVTVVEPGYFRTDFLDTSSLVETAERIPDYAGTVGKVREFAAAHNHQQPGDPANKTRQSYPAPPKAQIRHGSPFNRKSLPAEDPFVRTIDSTEAGSFKMGGSNPKNVLGAICFACIRQCRLSSAAVRAGICRCSVQFAVPNLGIRWRLSLGLAQKRVVYGAPPECRPEYNWAKHLEVWREWPIEQ